MKRSHRKGTTLIELLVVIVVFLVGILATLQIFAFGLPVLRTTRNNAVARQLARTEMERITSRPDILPEAVLPVRYALVGSAGLIITTPDLTPNPNDLGIPRAGAGDGIDANSNTFVGGSQIGRWDLVSGANRIRRVVGEGGKVPAPRKVGVDFGGLMMLQFAPISYDAVNYPTLLTVYGNDMVRRDGQPGFRVRSWEYFVDDAEESAALLYTPQDPSVAPSYRVTMSAWINNGTNTFHRTIIDAIVNGSIGTGYDQTPLFQLAGLQAGESFVGAEFESIRVARLFVPVNSFTVGRPYEYRVLDPRLGFLLFNPAGYNFQEIRPGRRLPLVAKANYDVFNWQIIRDDFRLPSTDELRYNANQQFQHRLQLSNLKIPSSPRADGKIYAGLDIPVQDGAGGTEQRFILLIDQDTGGIYTKDSFLIDTSTGLITFNDADNAAAGLQMNLIYPGQSAPTQITANGRSVRALYEAVGEWSVQLMMAPQSFTVTYSAPSVAQYYVGGSSGAGGVPTRIYFPVIDLGRKVVIGEVYYRDAGGNLKILRDQDFLIHNSPADPLGPYVDIRDIDGSASTLDFYGNPFGSAYGFAVKRVKGASIAVRVLWNPSVFQLTSDSAENLDKFDKWGRDWRRTTVETFLQRGEN